MIQLQLKSIFVILAICVSSVCIGWAEDTIETKGRRIVIRVLDKKGQPIRGAEVFRNHVFAIDDKAKAKIENETYVTNQDGEATVKLSGMSVDLRLWASKPGFVSYHAMWAKQFQPRNHEIPEKFTFRLPKGTQIGGIVTNEQGDPIRNATIQIVDEIALSHHGYRNGDARRPIRAYALTSGLITDDDGRWQIDNVPDDEMLGDLMESHFTIKICHPDYARAEFRDDNTIGPESTTTITLKNLRNSSANMVLKKPQ